MWHGSGDPVIRQCECVDKGKKRERQAAAAHHSSHSLSHHLLSPYSPKTDAKRSAIGAALAAAIAIPWAATFTLGGPRIVGRALFDRLNVATWDLDAYGLRF